MEWYYVEAGQRAGPVAEAEFQRLVEAGRIQGETLVWRKGMTEWQPYGRMQDSVPEQPPNVRPAEAGTTNSPQTGITNAVANQVVCIQCQGVFAQENTIPYGSGYICATCKPAFLQKLKEGATHSVGLSYAGFWIRFAAKLIDVAVFMVLAVPFIIYSSVSSFKKGAPIQPPLLTSLEFQLLTNLVGTFLSIAYDTFFQGKWGATLGKMACGIHVVTPNGGKISYARSFGRALADLLSVATCGIGYVIAAFDDQKRALHDHIASTRVTRVR